MKKEFVLGVLLAYFFMLFLVSCDSHDLVQVIKDTQQSKQTHSVNYNGNGNTSGSVPLDTSRYPAGATVTVLPNSGGLAKSGGYTFIGWSVFQNGTWKTCTVGSTLVMGNSDISFYANWTTLATYTVTYNTTGATSGSAPVDSNNYIGGGIVTVLGTGSLASAGNSFVVWNTAFDGTGTSYASGSTFVMPSSNVTLYPVWMVSLSGLTLSGSTITAGSLASVTSLVIPEGVTGIADGVLNTSYTLTSLTIPASLTNLGVGNFSNCQVLASLTVAAGNTHYCSVSNVLYNYTKTQLILVPAGLTGSFTVPSTVTSITDAALCGSNLSSVSLSSAPITSIGQDAFKSCPNLTTITIPTTVTLIGYSAFMSCGNLASVYFSSSTPPTLYSYAFDYVSASLQIHVPSIYLTAYQSAFTAYSSYVVSP